MQQKKETASQSYIKDYCLVIPNGTKHSQQEKGYGNCLVIPMVIPNGTKHLQQEKDTVNGVLKL